MTNKDSLGSVFSALSDPTRREVIRYLSESESTVTGLAARLPVTRQAVAKHLDALERAGLVASQPHGRETRYRLTPGPLADVMSWIADVGEEWDERLHRLRKEFERPRRHSPS